MIYILVEILFHYNKKKKYMLQVMNQDQEMDNLTAYKSLYRQYA